MEVDVLADGLDRLLRALLAVPGAVVGALDGRVVVPDVVGADEVAPRVIATAWHPEALLALEPDLHYVVEGERVLAWQHRGRTGFAVGGVNAPAGAKAGLLRAYAETCAQRGVRRQLVFPLRADELAEARAAGFDAVQVGVEAWLDLPGLTLRGRRFENLRQMRNRAVRRGLTVQEVAADLHAPELSRMHEAWLTAKRPSWRMKLLVGSPSFERPVGRRYLVARGPERVEAFLTLLPGAAGTWGVDVMCRWPDAVPGAIELLLADAVERLRAEGAVALSLGACPMAGVPHDRTRPVLSTAFRLLYGTALGNRIFGFRNLVRFKDKLAPRWEPVYFGARPGLGWWPLYQGCRMWGLY